MPRYHKPVFALLLYIIVLCSSVSLVCAGLPAEPCSSAIAYRVRCGSVSPAQHKTLGTLPAVNKLAQERYICLQDFSRDAYQWTALDCKGTAVCKNDWRDARKDASCMETDPLKFIDRRKLDAVYAHNNEL